MILVFYTSSKFDKEIESVEFRFQIFIDRVTFGIVVVVDMIIIITISSSSSSWWSVVVVGVVVVGNIHRAICHWNLAIVIVIVIGNSVGPATSIYLMHY